MKQINIAIDGYSSCGKGTLAKFVAQQLGYVFIDSGAMYRGLTLKLIENKIDISDLPAIENACKDLFFEFKLNQKKGSYELYVNGQNVEGSIRNLTVSNLVSEVAAISLVRKHLVRVQQAIGKNKGVVMDGRDIGTVVFPDADLKIFMTADSTVRAKRRFNELTKAGMEVSLTDVLANLKKRDYIDSNREDSPLQLKEDYKVLDNSNLSIEQQNSMAMKWVRESMEH